MLLKVVIVGEFSKIIHDALLNVGLLDPLQTKGHFGNFRTTVVVYEVNEDCAIQIRKELMNAVSSDKRTLALYEHGNWTNIYILPKEAFK